jgi:hypothetical protein
MSEYFKQTSNKNVYDLSGANGGAGGECGYGRACICAYVIFGIVCPTTSEDISKNCNIYCNNGNSGGPTSSSPGSVKFNIKNTNVCQSLTTTGQIYYLSADISTTLVNCFTVSAQDIVLDCQGHRITGTRGADAAILINANNFTLKNCTIFNWGTGVKYGGVTGNSNITDNTFSSNINGIIIPSVGNNLTLNAFIDNTQKGIMLSGSNNKIIRNRITSVISGAVGIDVSGTPTGAMNLIYDNLFNNTNNVVATGAGQNFWNTTLNCSAGVSSIMNGPCIGGNYWGKLDRTGFSDTCVQVDGICNAPNNLLLPNNVDQLPLGIKTTFTSANWTDLQNKSISGAQIGDTVRLVVNGININAVNFTVSKKGILLLP